jgi:hypothetical protein
MGTKHLMIKLSELLEKLASIEHERWAHWQRYLHSQCTPVGNDGALLIPSDLVHRWEAEMRTPYSELTEEQKESDRQQVRRYLPVIAEVLGEKTAACART